ncbi:MAG: DUF6128 domain-containing protein [Roseburia sp.]|nr:DUF6128 domain-containing protein [Roseburia sp.]
MAGFQRFISYLYKYENDDRQENIGFAKVEIRGTSYRLEVHVRNLNMEKPDCTVYLFARKEEIMQGVTIGEMYIRRGNGDMRYVFEEKDLQEFGMTMDRIEGIFISVTEGLYIASQWKEGEIKEANLLPLKKGEMQPREELGSSAPEVEQENDPGQTGTEQAAGKEESELGQEEKNQEQESVEIRQNVQEQNPARAESVPEENKKETQREKRESGEQEQENLKATEIPMEKFLEDLDLEGAFQKLRLKLTVFFPFQGEEIECVKVDITDLQELPKKYWYLGKNSFLLHGFFNYRHLIMGEIKQEDKSEYFIGVPGVFQNQERIMAAMFGFPEFRTAEQSEYKTGNFGYWYRIM